MTVPRPVGAGLVLIAAVTVVGTIGYMVIVDLGFVDALYMTVITISTVGFTEIGGPFDSGAQLFTILIMIGGVGTVLYTAAVGLEWAFEAILGGERSRRRAMREIRDMEHHVVLCGFGRVGRDVWRQLHGERDMVVIDRDPERVHEAQEVGAVAIEGDATRDEVLIEAGIDRASVLMAAVKFDADNLVIVLSGKARRPELLVIARAADSESEKKLYLAGADRVVAPQVVGAHRMAALAHKPGLADFIDLVVSGRLVEFRVQELTVVPDSEFAGRSLRELDVRGKAGAVVLAIEDGSGRLTLNPDPDERIMPGQIVIGIGTEDQLDRLRVLAEG